MEMPQPKCTDVSRFHRHINQTAKNRESKGQYTVIPTNEKIQYTGKRQRVMIIIIAATVEKAVESSRKQ